MAVEIGNLRVPLSEQALRDFARAPFSLLPKFAEEDSEATVKQLRDVIDLILSTADVDDLSSTHRTAACNASCALIETCQGSSSVHMSHIVLTESVWLRFLRIYLERCEDAKGKSMRQMLLTLTGALLKHQNERSQQFGDQAITMFLEIICRRQDRLKVKPALQGLAHFLQKDVVTLRKLIDLYWRLLPGHDGESLPIYAIAQSIFKSFLSWAVHHDTSLSAGHLIKQFLALLRRDWLNTAVTSPPKDLPIWIEPVTIMFQEWQDRIQEFKTHVFPHCFLPNIEEYIRFLSHLHFAQHIYTEQPLPENLCIESQLPTVLNSLEEFKLLLAALQTGKELGLIKDIDYRKQARVTIIRNSIVVPDIIFSKWLSDPEAEVRLAGLFLSVYSNAVTRPITRGIFKSIRRNLVHLHAETDANFRKELLLHTQRLLERIKGSTVAHMKAKTGKTGLSLGRIPFVKSLGNGRPTLSIAAEDPLTEPLGFLLWYVHFLKWELRPTASYQRRAIALRSLSVVLKSGLDPRVPYRCLSKSGQGQLGWAHTLSIITQPLIRSLLDLVFDAFDDVRAGAASLLEMCLDSLDDSQKDEALRQLTGFILCAETTMLQTGRADQADGLARAYFLMFSQGSLESKDYIGDKHPHSLSKYVIFGRLIEQLEETLKTAREDLTIAVDQRPVHGIFAALRYIVDQDDFYDAIASAAPNELHLWNNYHNRILICVRELWTCVKDVLCADAPEGHVPEDIEENLSIDTKEILSYSWRGLKEASILLRAIVTRCPIGRSETSLLKNEDVQSFGDFCFTQLVELRHRGAFATVAQTFAAFCRRCICSKDESLVLLPSKWYQDTVICMQAKASSITRRSAGIPSLITGIVSSDQPNGKLLTQAMKDLFKEASLPAESTNIEESRLPQVHALNSIKEIFISSKLSAASEEFIGEGLDLAARTLNSNIWPIRNCSLMLFKALIERLLGSDETQDWQDRDRTRTSRFSYNSYPHLLRILVNLLDPNGPLRGSMTTTAVNNPMDLHGAEGVFPALQILRQAPPPEPHRTIITNSVLYLLGSPHWHLRDMAARTLVSLMYPHEHKKTILWFIESLDGPFNEQHGKLLAIKYLLFKYLHAGNGYSGHSSHEILLALRNKASFINSKAHDCPFTKAAFDDIVVFCGKSVLVQPQGLESTISTWEELFNYIKGHEHRATGKDESLLCSALDQCRLLEDMLNNHISDKNTLSASYPSPIGVHLNKIAAQDPDSCCAVLNMIDNCIRMTYSFRINASVDLMSHIYGLSLIAEDHKVKAKAQSILANALQDQQILARFLETVNEDDIDRTIQLLREQTLNGPPSNGQIALSLQGLFLDLAFKQWAHLDGQSSSTGFNPTNELYLRQALDGLQPNVSELFRGQSLLLHISRYLRVLRFTMIDTNPFDARYAAVQSISRVNYMFRADVSDNSNERLILGFAFTLYDMLNDDDDEIRNAAALTTGRFLRAQKFSPSSKNTVPIVSVKLLTRFLSSTFPRSKGLCKEGVRRLIGLKSHHEIFTLPFAETLAVARKEDTALFSQEKQNLFKDDAMDASLWANALRQLSNTALPKKYYAHLSTWVLDGLSALTEIAKKESDGPLGWTTKTEVFTLGIRVLGAADVLLAWSCVHSSTIRRNLRGFVDVSAQTGVNSFWLEKAERVLEDSIVKALSDVRQTLQKVYSD